MDKEKLIAQIEQLQREHQNHLEQAFMCLGAIQAARHWLAEWEANQIPPGRLGPQLVPPLAPVVDKMPTTEDA